MCDALNYTLRFCFCTKKGLWRYSRSNICTGHQPQDVGSSHKVLDQHRGDRQHVEAANAGAIAQNISGNGQLGGKCAQFGGTRNYREFGWIVFYFIFKQKVG